MATLTQNYKSFSIPTKFPERSTLKTMIEKFYHWEKTMPDKVFLRQPYGDTWKTFTFAEAGREARKIATWIREQVPAKSHIGLVSKNHSYWIITDLAIAMADCISVPFFPTLNAEQLNQVLVHSECKILFVGKLDNWQGMKEGIPANVKTIALPDSPAKELLQWESIAPKIEPLQENVKPDLDEVFTIIYTSGTTGTPKGAMITHLNTAMAMETNIQFLHLNHNDNQFFSYLPLCHIAERCIVEAFSIQCGGTVSFVESIDTFGKNLEDAQPTHFLAVPRIWIKFQMGILAKMPQKKLNFLLSLPIISSLVKKKIKKKLGLSRARMIVTGAAPMPAETLKWFHKLDIRIQEVYGMTENHAACTIMREDNMKIGTVGQPFPGVELRIDPQNGEIQMRAPWIMKGYYKDPEKTAEVIDSEGWLHTGDVGELDDQGFLKITGRVKDTFKTTKGEFIVPAPIEWGFATNHFIEQICVTGRTLDQPVALVVLSEIGLKASKDEVSKSLEHSCKEVNAGLPNYARISKIIITKEAWTVDNGMLTPTLKIKRNILEDRYAPLLAKAMSSDKMVVWE
ncbi:AMP-binding protein [Raineya orbicola]|uniref:Long-chain acyl-CoA synthetase n=1 Tax=Raineya orbicola TaxID=2016530 RepID=A0A2N3III4_9BACT|nr:AMP-binding protein [Raineya orbicola]PKQ70068.1 Long-chain acyl-CoA synthetase [Raineya orbicola]